jgi:hypothetical protein
MQAMGVTSRHISNQIPLNHEQMQVLYSFQEKQISSVKELLPFDREFVLDFKQRLLALINSRDFQKYTMKMKAKIIIEYQRMHKNLY